MAAYHVSSAAQLAFLTYQSYPQVFEHLTSREFTMRFVPLTAVILSLLVSDSFGVLVTNPGPPSDGANGVQISSAVIAADFTISSTPHNITDLTVWLLEGNGGETTAFSKISVALSAGPSIATVVQICLTQNWRIGKTVLCRPSILGHWGPRAGKSSG